jgi:hypothetical protein
VKEGEAAYEQTLRQGGERTLREASAYFSGGGQLRSTLRRLVERLNAEKIPYMPCWEDWPSPNMDTHG